MVVVTQGIEHELSSVALTIALGGLTAGLKVSLFLTSSGVTIVGASAIHELIRNGAATLSF
ncbi:MAG TPA: hypothetical protein VLJ57_24855 [Burkholderiaceae bacterium]|nr:hypothetical protein [Burkholderiaceae bacterium]